MILPQYSHHPEGAVIDVGGRRMRHLGDGHFTPADVGGEPMLKRFGVEDGELTFRRVS